MVKPPCWESVHTDLLVIALAVITKDGDSTHFFQGVVNAIANGGAENDVGNGYR